MLSEWEYGSGGWLWVVLVGSLPWWCPVLGWVVVWCWAVHGAVLVAGTTSGWARRLVAKAMLESSRWSEVNADRPYGWISSHLGFVFGFCSLLRSLILLAKEQKELETVADLSEALGCVVANDDHFCPLNGALSSISRLGRRAYLCPVCHSSRKIWETLMVEMAEILEVFVIEWRAYDGMQCRRIIQNWMGISDAWVNQPQPALWDKDNKHDLQNKTELLEDALANPDVFSNQFPLAMIRQVFDRRLQPPKDSPARRSFLSSLERIIADNYLEAETLHLGVRVITVWGEKEKYRDQILLLVKRRPTAIRIAVAHELHFIDTDPKYRYTVLKAGRKTGRHFKGFLFVLPTNVQLNEGLPAVLGLSLQDEEDVCDIVWQCREFQRKASQLLEDPLDYLLFRDTGALDHLVRHCRRLEDPCTKTECLWDVNGTPIHWPQATIDRSQERIAQFVDRSKESLADRPASVCQKLCRVSDQPQRLRITFRDW